MLLLMCYVSNLLQSEDIHIYRNCHFIC